MSEYYGQQAQDVAGSVESRQQNALSKKSFMHAKQSAHCYFDSHNVEPDALTNIPRNERKQITEALFPSVITPQQTLQDENGETVKTLHRLSDGQVIEFALMFYAEDKRVILCISCQVGCALNCSFCAAGRLGLVRNLSCAEIVEQVRFALLEASRRGILLKNVVFMGEGEPTSNLQVVLDSAAIISDPQLFAISARNITISTARNAPAIKKMALNPLQFRLAVSLHAPDNRLRNQLMPINGTWNVDAVLDPALDYHKTKNSRISVEYALMRDINDTQEHAFLLARSLNTRVSNWAHVNLIPLNEIEDSDYKPSTANNIAFFQNILKKKGIFTTLRSSRGQLIDGGCGQLAAKVRDGDEHVQ
ncbi:MAG: radical SAM protein [Candidatus Ancillula trichonymphae]|nr:radical SAM protein [Candidatus Ancillula trichonymphae]